MHDSSLLGGGMRKVSFIIFVFLCFATTRGFADSPTPPNVLFVLVDDFGARDLGCYGSRVFETPNMDRLAKSGILFSDAYVAYPRCVPSRFAIMTGKHPARYQGDRDSVHVELDRDSTFGQAFLSAGYETFYAGEWHLGHGPGGVGFSAVIAAGSAGAARSQFAPDRERVGWGKRVDLGGRPII